MNLIEIKVSDQEVDRYRDHHIKLKAINLIFAIKSAFLNLYFRTYIKIPRYQFYTFDLIGCK